MAFWLVKSEPSEWSWDDQIRHGKTNWDGVRNHQAAGNLKRMKRGDLVFFYRSVVDPAIMGIMQVDGLACPDPSDPTGVFVMVPMVTDRALTAPVSLKMIKSEPAFADLALVRQSRLSVMPIDEGSWLKLCELGKITDASRTHGR